MVEPQIVILVVAGSSPVDHPIFFKNRTLLASGLFFIDFPMIGSSMQDVADLSVYWLYSVTFCFLLL